MPIHADYSASTKEIERSHKLPKIKVGDRLKITEYQNIFSWGDTYNWSRETFVINFVLKANRRQRGKIIKCFYEKGIEDRHIRDKVKIALDLINYVTKMS